MNTRLASTLLAAAVAAACTEPAPSNTLRVSGHVEATETRLAPDAGGRILTFDLAEGDRIEAGHQVLTLDRRDIELSLQRARAEQAQADAQLRLVLAGARAEDIRQAESQVTAAEADVSAARAELAAAERDLERFETLLTTNSGSRKQRDDAATRRDVARQRVTAAESRVRAAREALGRLQAGARREEIEAARARLAATAAQIASLEKSLADTTFTSPVSGIVTEKLVEPGEVIAPRTPVAVVVDLDQAWADVFVPEPAVPRLRLGQDAQVYTDAGGSPITGAITYISPRAEFTPRNVQTAEERSKLVYRVRISVDNTAGILKQGMPVEAEIALAPVS
ncbi:MAG: HlyD family secretion protein [Vicinamibacterales bacterium]